MTDGRMGPVRREMSRPAFVVSRIRRVERWDGRFGMKKLVESGFGSVGRNSMMSRKNGTA